MDPNAALNNIREAVGELRQQDDDGVLDGTSQVGFLLESFEALDEWLTKGGFLPDEWTSRLLYRPAENLIVTITNPPGCEGTAYRLTTPDGENRIVDETGEHYAELAGLIDDIFEADEEPEEVRP